MVKNFQAKAAKGSIGLMSENNRLKGLLLIQYLLLICLQLQID
jgi:hypothetical protein